jgi:hypothetical protein
MIDEKFWNKYERNMSNPISRIFNRAEIREMEDEIRNANDFVSSYEADGLNMNSTKKYERNMAKIQQQESLLKRQAVIVGNSFMAPSEKSEGVGTELFNLEMERINFRNLYEHIIDYEAKTAETNDSLDYATELLSKEGLYLNAELYSATEVNDSRVKLVYESDLKGYIEKNFESTPSVAEIVSFAQEEKLWTKTPPDIQKEVLKELDKVDFAVEDVPFSYANYCSEFSEAENVPTVHVFNDANLPYETLSYNPEMNTWHGEKYEFNIPNPVNELQKIYNENKLSVGEIISIIEEPEMDDPSNDFMDEDQTLTSYDPDAPPNRIQAEALSEGWMWVEYPDGSCCLESPDGESYSSYEIHFGGNIEHQNLEDKHWELSIDGFSEFKNEVEQKMISKLGNQVAKSQSNEQSLVEAPVVEIRRNASAENGGLSASKDITR